MDERAAFRSGRERDPNETAPPVQTQGPEVDSPYRQRVRANHNMDRCCTDAAPSGDRVLARVSDVLWASDAWWAADAWSAWRDGGEPESRTESDGMTVATWHGPWYEPYFKKRNLRHIWLRFGFGARIMHSHIIQTCPGCLHPSSCHDDRPETLRLSSTT